jgi:hypothetical protein
MLAIGPVNRNGGCPNVSSGLTEHRSAVNYPANKG